MIIKQQDDNALLLLSLFPVRILPFISIQFESSLFQKNIFPVFLIYPFLQNSVSNIGLWSILMFHITIITNLCIKSYIGHIYLSTRNELDTIHRNYIDRYLKTI